MVLARVSDPDSNRSVDPDPYSEDEGVRVRAPGCAGRHFQLHVHSCSRRGKTAHGPGFGGSGSGFSQVSGSGSGSVFGR
jgi:hypothetical protein